MRALVVSVAEHVRAHRWALWSLRALPMLAIFSTFVVSGLRGVDFGFHWDEVEAQIQPVRNMISTGLLLPRASGYPSFSKFLTLMPTVPVGVQTAVKMKGNPRAAQAAMLTKANGADFLLSVRRIYVVFSALAIVWIWAAVLALRRPWWEAAAAAAGVGLSWEYAYHARWVATDCPMVMFSALTLFMLALFFRKRRPLWLYASAAAAGLATGTKYQGVALLVPVLLAGALTLPIRAVGRQALRVVALPALAFAAFLITTPNLIFEPFGSVEELLRIARYYEGSHWGFSVTSTWQHHKLVLIYLLVSLLSPYQAIAVALFAFGVVGAVFMVRRDRRLGIVLVSFPILFLLLFCGRYRVVIVRNYLLVLPLLAMFAARGLSEVGALLPRRWLRFGLAGVAAVAFGAGGVWLVRAGESIRHPDPIEEVRGALAYVSKHPRTGFKLSPQVTAMAKKQNFPIPPNAQATAALEPKEQKLPAAPNAQAAAARPDQVVFFARAEGQDVFLWKSNDPWLTKAVFGPREVNFNWYSTWMGPDRVVIMRTDKAKWAAGIKFVK